MLKVDLRHGQAKRTGQTKGLLIESGAEYNVDGLGGQTRIGAAAR